MTILLLSISERTFRNWTKAKRESIEEEQNRKIFELWMQCYSTTEIAEGMNINPQTVTNRVGKFVPKNGNFAEIRNEDFKPQLYNLWNFQQNNKVKHFGNIPP